MIEAGERVTVTLRGLPVAELHLGVLAAPDDRTRARRLHTLEEAGDFMILPIVTRDADFDPIAGVAGVVVIRA